MVTLAPSIGNAGDVDSWAQAWVAKNITQTKVIFNLSMVLKNGKSGNYWKMIFEERRICLASVLIG